MILYKVTKHRTPLLFVQVEVIDKWRRRKRKRRRIMMIENEMKKQRD